MVAAQVQACTKKLRWYQDPPYSMRLPDGRIGGWSVDLTQELMKRMGCTLVMEEMPFARALLELKEGRIDMLDGAFATPERLAYAHFSKPTLRSRNLVFIRTTDRARFKEQTLGDLHRAGWQFGIQAGVAYGPAYSALEKDASFRAKRQTVPRRAGLWKMLALGRVDVVIADELTARYELGAAKLDEQITATTLVVSEDPSPMAFSKATTDLGFVQRFDTALQTMRIDGSYDRLRQRYGVKPLDDSPTKR